MKPRPDPLQRLFELSRDSTAEGRAVVPPPGFAPRVLRHFAKPVGLEQDIATWERFALWFLAGGLAVAVVSVWAFRFEGGMPVAPEEEAAVQMVQVAFLER
jgi:hypothetical protein